VSASADRDSRRRSGSLERSLQWTLGLLVLTALLSITLAGVWIVRQVAEQFVASRLAHDAEALIAGWTPGAEEIGRPLPPVYRQPFSGHYFILTFDGGTALRSRSLWDFALDVEPLPPGESALDLRQGPRSQRLLLWRAGYEKGGRPFTVAVAEDIDPLLGELRTLLWEGVVASVLAALVLLLVQRRLLRRGFRRIDAVRADIRRLDSGETDRLSEEVPAEVRPLVRELNALIGAWRSHLARSRNALGNLAHALKSPLNLILLHHAAGEEDPVAAQALRMRDLIERELRRARLAGEHSPGRRFRPREDIDDLVAGMRTLHADKSLEIVTEIRAPDRLVFDQEDMLELAGNLLDNACKWARGRVYLGLSADDGLSLRLEDDGPGVAPEESERLASRGGRLDESVPGHGLGLAIVGEIVRMLGGRLELGRSQRLGGLAAEVKLPFPRAGP
jgi:signal transduction histidine kinase